MKIDRQYKIDKRINNGAFPSLLSLEKGNGVSAL
jgi:hypothetical protein